MDREAWQAIVQRVTRVKHNLATKPPPLGLLTTKVNLPIPTPTALRNPSNLRFSLPPGFLQGSQRVGRSYSRGNETGIFIL